jgi:hypothetical protein
VSPGDRQITLSIFITQTSQGN